MNIPFFSSKKEEISNRNYFGLFLKEGQGIGFVIVQERGRFIITEQQKFEYSNLWNNLKEDIDDVLFKLENKTRLHLKETIFFVYSHLVDQKTKEIKKDYFNKIKDLAKNLELDALGYIECYEAIAHCFQKKEDLPLTAVIAELDKSNISIFVFKGGKNVFSKTIDRTGDIVDDVIESFHEIKGKLLLPARIILYNSKDIEDEAAKIIKHRWSEDLFVRLPRVEIIKEHEILKELIDIFRKQINKKGHKTVVIQNKQLEKDLKEEDITYDKEEIMGFAIGKEVDKKKEKPEEKYEEHEKKVLPKKATDKKSFFAILSNNLKSFFSAIKINNIKFPKRNIKILIGSIIIVILIGVAIFANEFFLHKADVTVYFHVEEIEKSVTINDFEIKTNTFSAKFSDSKLTTGKKEIGDKAHGEVTVYNFDNQEKTAIKDTVFEIGGLKFQLDEEIKVASASLKADLSAKLPGTKKANLVALAIGEEGNIGQESIFTIENNSKDVFFAKNDKAFTGGSKKEINTVSKKDIDDLKKTILNQSKNDDKVSAKPKDFDKDDRFIDDLTENELIKIKYSKEIGEEAEKVSISGEMQSIVYYYDNNKLLDHLFDELKDEIKSGYKLKKEEIAYKIDDADKNNNNDKIDLEISVKAKSIKDVKEEDIVNKITGKKTNVVKNILKQDFKAEDYELHDREYLFLFKKFMPFFAQNIQLNISVK